MRASISAVNWGEVAQRVVEEHPAAAALDDARVRLEAVGLTIEPHLREDADAAARLRSATRHLGLSLADRCCLALALRLDLPALTADRVWSTLPSDLHVNVQLIRA